MKIQVKRIYDAPSTSDGVRILVDRLWPRGIKKGDAKIDLWLKDIAPSTTLRKWYAHDPEKWTEFQKKYGKELEDKSELLEKIVKELKKGSVTLLYSSKETERNNAVCLKNYLDELV